MVLRTLKKIWEIFISPLNYSVLTIKYAVHPHPNPLPQGRGISEMS